MSELIVSPSKVIFGAGSVEELASYLPQVGAILLVTGNHAKSSVLPKVLAQFSGRVCSSVSDISPELPVDDIERICSAARSIDAKIIVAIGGGSVIDAGKVAAAITPLGGTIRDYFYGRRKISGKGLFFAAVPTTSGTGSEATPNSVLYDYETGIKQSIRHDTMLPDVALVDPMLTWDCPAATTANSGLDAITQAIESAISKKRTDYTYALAVKALKLMLPALKLAVDNDEKGRSDMAYGSMLTGLAFALSGLGAVHGLAHPVGALYHIAHGKACAIILPYVMRWNREFLGELAADLNFKDVDEFIAYIDQLSQDLGIPSKLNVDMDDNGREFIVKNCRSGSMNCNPRYLDDEDIVQLLGEIV